MQSYLKIPVIEDYVHLGCSPEERTFKHRVHFSVELSFATLPAACTTDSMDKTPCYAEIAELIHSLCQEKHYATIEYLSHCGFEAVEKYCDSFTDLKTKSIDFEVHKLNPPVAHIKEGTLFKLSKQK